jgi:hypothetical protein
MLGEALPAAFERPVVDHLVEAERGDERTQPVFTGTFRPRHVESLQFADVVVLAAGLGLHDLLDHHGRTEIRVPQCSDGFVTRPRIHDPALTGSTNAGEKGRPCPGGRVVAAAGRLGRADPRIVSERVDLPDDRHLRPVAVVRRRFPEGEQSRAQLLHHRLIDVGERLGELIARSRAQRNRLVQIQQGMAVVRAHQPTGISSVSTGREPFMSLRSVSVGPTSPGSPAAASA